MFTQARKVTLLLTLGLVFMFAGLQAQAQETTTNAERAAVTYFLQETGGGDWESCPEGLQIPFGMCGHFTAELSKAISTVDSLQDEQGWQLADASWTVTDNGAFRTFIYTDDYGELSKADVYLVRGYAAFDFGP